MNKQEILHEIKRTAAENGNKPLGRAAFYKATGITESDWSGKYWSRWSDAVREAGLFPNQMTTGYEKELLIGKVIELTREIGHFPGSRDLRLKAFNERGFPSSTTFEAHFGLKSDLVSKVAEYCRKKEGFEDVIRACEEVVLAGKDSRDSEGDADDFGQVGLVYLIKSGRFYKIGKTKSIGRRVYDLALQLAEKPTTLHVIKTDDPDGIETYWHKRFSAKRKNGEWFNLNAADVKSFKRWLRIV